VRTAAAAGSPADEQRLARVARALLVVTIGWNIVEGAVAVVAGVYAGSVALMGFGLDSSIEVVAASVLLWRMWLAHDDERAEHRERRARLIVGVTFVALAIYVLAESAYVLAGGHQPDTSPAGVWLSLAVLAGTPVLGIAKRRNAVRLRSSALVAEATETLICSYLSLTLFVGLAANIAFGWWWADVAAALAMVPWIAKEGIESVRGESGEG
jgi:divalent metal cation (Fe/Co/Zn/Cd) transporter